MKKKAVVFLMFLSLLLAGYGCAYRYYIGMHGPSIKLSPDVHEGAREDSRCLECHHPDNSSQGPATTHPHFTGCLKCHNDEP